MLAARSGATPRAAFICDPNSRTPHTLQQWFNTSCITDVPTGEIWLGVARRNGNRAVPAISVGDLSLFKNFHLRECGLPNLQFRFETFKHTNWASIGATLGSSMFGQVTSARDPRSAQLPLRPSF